MVNLSLECLITSEHSWSALHSIFPRSAPYWAVAGERFERCRSLDTWPYLPDQAADANLLFEGTIVGFQVMYGYVVLLFFFSMFTSVHRRCIQFGTAGASKQLLKPRPAVKAESAKPQQNHWVVSSFTEHPQMDGDMMDIWKKYN